MGYVATFLTVMVVVLATAVVRVAEGQAQCANQLVPCYSYLNATTRPPATCCDPIRQAVSTDLTCLCNLYRDPTFLSQIGINVTQALRLPTLCGLPADASACAIAPTSSHGSPPGPGQPRNNGAQIVSAGIFSFLLIAASASMMFY